MECDCPEAVGEAAAQSYQMAQRVSLDLPDGPLTSSVIQAAFRAAAKKAHPDHGGNTDAFRELVAERDELLRRSHGYIY